MFFMAYDVWHIPRYAIVNSLVVPWLIRIDLRKWPLPCVSTLVRIKKPFCGPRYRFTNVSYNYFCSW